MAEPKLTSYARRVIVRAYMLGVESSALAEIFGVGNATIHRATRSCREPRKRKEADPEFDAESEARIAIAIERLSKDPEYHAWLRIAEEEHDGREKNREILREIAKRKRTEFDEAVRKGMVEV